MNAITVGLLACCFMLVGVTPTFKPSPAKLAGMSVVLQMENGHCTGTKVGPHTIVTDHHCFALGGDLKTVDKGAVTVKHIEHDGSDHTLVVTDLTFDRWATINPAPQATGDTVHVMGNPNLLRGAYRRGYVILARSMDLPCSPLPTVVRPPGTEFCELAIYDFPGGGGDSGAGVFDDRGRLRAVLYGQYPVSINEGDIASIVAIAMPLTFTPAQYRAAGVRVGR